MTTPLIVCLAFLALANAAKLRDRLIVDTTLTKGAKGNDLLANRASLPGYMHDVLLSIDEKLRNLDSYSYPHRLSKIEFSLEQMGRRLENIEAKLSRMETKFEIRLENVEDVVNEKDRKDDFSNGQMGRQMDNLNDKFNSKFAVLDTKIEMRLDRVNQKIEALEREIQVYGDDVLEKLAKSDERQSLLESRLNSQTLENSFQRIIREENNKFNAANIVTAWMEENLLNHSLISASPDSDLNSLLKNQSAMILDSLDYLKENCQEFNHTSDNRLRSILNDYDFVSYSSQTKEKMENITATLQRSLRLNEGRFKKLDNDVESYSRKVVNSIHDLRQSSDQLTGVVRDMLQEGNVTRQVVRRGFDELRDRIKPLSAAKPEVPEAVGAGENLDRRLYELGTKVDNKFGILLTAQNTFIDSCSRIQEEETQVYEALSKVVQEVRTRSQLDMDQIARNLQNHSHFLTQNLETILMAIIMSSNETADRIVDLILTRKVQVPTSAGCDCARESNEITQNLDNLRSKFVGTEAADPVHEDKSKTPGDRVKPLPVQRADSEEPSTDDNPAHKSTEKSIHGGALLDYDPDYQMQEAEYFDT